jgi:hypothetical protein
MVGFGLATQPRKMICRKIGGRPRCTQGCRANNDYDDDDDDDDDDNDD